MFDPPRSVESVREKRKPKEHRRVAMVRPVASYAPAGRPLVQVFAPDASEDESREAFLTRVKGSARRTVAKALVMNRARLVIPSDRAIGIQLEGDLHVSTEGTDLDWIFDRAALVARTPDLYAIGVGDLLDNPIKHAPRNTKDVKDQLRLLDIIIEEHQGKFLGTVSGNHDDWTDTFAGFDHLLALAKRHGFHYAKDELIWDVDIVDPTNHERVTASWTIATRHAYRRHSNLNLLHACSRWCEEQVANWERIPDVLALAHNHGAAHGVTNFRGKDIWGVRFGSPQVDSGYARQKGFPSYRPTAPVVVLPHTQSARIQCFADAEDAVTFMRGARDVAS